MPAKSSGHSRRSPLDTAAISDLLDQPGQLEQIGDVEGRTSRRYDDEGVEGHSVGPLSGQGDQLTAGAQEVHTIRAPVLAALDELELLASPRMERMCDPNPLSGGQVLGITCS